MCSMLMVYLQHISDQRATEASRLVLSHRLVRCHTFYSILVDLSTHPDIWSRPSRARSRTAHTTGRLAARSTASVQSGELDCCFTDGAITDLSCTRGAAHAAARISSTFRVRQCLSCREQARGVESLAIEILVSSDDFRKG